MNTLYYGDNLDVLREHIADESVDLIYLDPPFNSNATYNVLFKAPAGQRSESQVEAFQDTWTWGRGAARAFDEVVASGLTDAVQVIRALRLVLKENDLMAYIAMMAVRLLELHRVLKPTGSLYLHCDPIASHYLKVLLDAIFGSTCFRNEIVWKRTSGHSDARRFGSNHDTILFYTKSDVATWNTTFQPYEGDYVKTYYRYRDKDGRRFMSGDLSAAGLQGGGYDYEWKGVRRVWRVPITTMEKLDREGRIFITRNGIPRAKRYLDQARGMPAQDTWIDLEALRSWHGERLGYPTQKPMALLERIIESSSNEGDLVLDPFCGCGTTVHVAQKLDRRWLGIDITHLAISLIERRLKDAFPGLRVDVEGTPRDLGGAQDLARRNKYQFQWWAVSLVDAVPQGGKKKGADRGIDGIRWVRSGPYNLDVEQVIVSVKGGDTVGVAMIRDLVGVVERERALAGLMITLAEPTREMRKEAASAGTFETSIGRFAKIQIYTVKELLGKVEIDLPPLGRHEGFKRAPRERGPQPTQTDLDV